MMTIKSGSLESDSFRTQLISMWSFWRESKM